MGVRKLSVALEEGVASSASASAERQGLSLSAWLTRAAQDALAIEDGRAAVEEWQAEHGRFTREELRAADAILTRPPRRVATPRAPRRTRRG
jgi:hypothetical protein